MRSQADILTRLKERQENDMLGFEWTMYIDCLDYKRAKQFLKGSVSKKEWDKVQRTTYAQIREHAIDYLDFAWEKANEYRGLSAQRSIMHYIAWFWLMEEDEASESVEKQFRENYQYYGKDILVWISNHLGVDPSKYDDGVRVNEEPGSEGIEETEAKSGKSA